MFKWGCSDTTSKLVVLCNFPVRRDPKLKFKYSLRFYKQDVSIATKLNIFF